WTQELDDRHQLPVRPIADLDVRLSLEIHARKKDVRRSFEDGRTTGWLAPSRSPCNGDIGTARKMPRFGIQLMHVNVLIDFHDVPRVNLFTQGLRSGR